MDFYRVGLARIEDRWMDTSERGERFADPHHEDTLALWLLAPAKREEIDARQQAIAEIRARLDLREELAILGGQSTAGVSPDACSSWASSPRKRLPIQRDGSKMGRCYAPSSATVRQWPN